jgi:hypothetical protein
MRMNNTDQRIDRILYALGSVDAPAGLEQRVHARMAQRAAESSEEQPAGMRSLLAAISSPFHLPYGYALAATVAVLLAGGFALLHRTQPEQVAHQQVVRRLQQKWEPQSAQVLRMTPNRYRTTLPDAQMSNALPSATPSQEDPDAIALAETLAPSHPAPPLAPTAQETLLLRSTRPGQPIEVAELDTLRESALTAIAATRERSSVREYVHALLGPLAAAQTLTPTSPAQEENSPLADNEPPSSK